MVRLVTAAFFTIRLLSHCSGAPLCGSTAPKPCWSRPARESKPPPTIRRLPSAVRASARTPWNMSLTLLFTVAGAKVVIRAPDGNVKPARLLRGSPPALVTVPPTYTAVSEAVTA
jgi:hypothetical protein